MMIIMSAVHIVILPYQLLISCDSTNFSTNKMLCHLMPILTLHHGLARRRRCLSYPASSQCHFGIAAHTTFASCRLPCTHSERMKTPTSLSPTPPLRQQCWLFTSLDISASQRSARCWPLRPRNPCESFNRPKFSCDFYNLSLI